MLNIARFLLMKNNCVRYHNNKSANDNGLALNMWHTIIEIINGIVLRLINIHLHVMRNESFVMPKYGMVTWLHTTIKQQVYVFGQKYPDSKVHGANMGPIWGR